MVELRWIVRGTGKIRTYSYALGPLVVTEETERVLQCRQRVMDPSRSHEPSWTDWQDVPVVTTPDPSP